MRIVCLFIFLVGVLPWPSSAYTSFLPKPFVQSFLRRASQRPERINTFVPANWNLKKYLGIQGPAADLYVVGLLARLAFGDAISEKAPQNLDKLLQFVAPLESAELQSNEAFLLLPPEHRQLLEWWLGQPDRTVSPDSLLDRAVSICDGDLFKALIVGWDLLSSGWRDHLPGATMRREAYPRTRKLAEIPHVAGDMFPSWYHFWGLMTYTYYISAETLVPYVLPQSSAAFLIAIEELLGWPKRKTENAWQRAEISFAGARAGAILYRESRKFNANRDRYLNALGPDLNYIKKQVVSVQWMVTKTRKLLNPALKPLANFCEFILESRRL